MENEFEQDLLEVSTTSFQRIRQNGMLLSDQQISLLERNGFSYLKYSTISELLFDLEEYLNTDSSIEDFDLLDQISIQLAEQNYYQNTNH